MSLDDLTLFSAVKKRLAWVSQRQEVLAQNVANADTPDYKATDLKPFKFRDILRQESMQINMDASGKGHMGGQRKSIRSFSEAEVRMPYETAPGGNSVVLEEQVQKLNQTAISHKFTAEIYRKHLSMLKMALGRG
jgi:flagellar basal-body rod protein FlgB